MEWEKLTSNTSPLRRNQIQDANAELFFNDGTVAACNS